METEMKKCTYCNEDINLKARRCPYCGSLLGMDVVKTKNLDMGDQSSNNTNTEVLTDTEVSNENYEIDGYNNFNAYNQSFNNNQVNEDKFDYLRDERKGLTNAMKVFLTVITSIVPGFGQIVGIILAIIFMNSEDDLDKRSFGVALLVASLVIFVIACLSCFILILTAGKVYEGMPFQY